MNCGWTWNWQQVKPVLFVWMRRDKQRTEKSYLTVTLSHRLQRHGRFPSELRCSRDQQKKQKLPALPSLENSFLPSLENGFRSSLFSYIFPHPWMCNSFGICWNHRLIETEALFHTWCERFYFLSLGKKVQEERLIWRLWWSPWRLCFCCGLFVCL